MVIGPSIAIVRAGYRPSVPNFVQPKNYHTEHTPPSALSVHSKAMLRYAITSRVLFPGSEEQKQAALVEQCARWAVESIDIIQLREKDLLTGALASLTRSILAAISGANTKLLINSRADVALATGAHGVHLTAVPAELAPGQVRYLYEEAGRAVPFVSVSCHTLDEVKQARANQADAILFAPVFGKTAADHAITPAAGVEALRKACAAAAPVPVHALGGITLENAASCIEAGARGIAGIRLFAGRT